MELFKDALLKIEGKERRGGSKEGFEPMIFESRGVCFTAVLQPLKLGAINSIA